jgi:dihydrofolate synthase/folylpolyglutamate synthase
MTRIAASAGAAGASWLHRGGVWDATLGAKSIRYRDAIGHLELPLPRLPGRYQAMNAALAVAMLRHQDRLTVPATALKAAVEWTDWPARLQQLAEGPLTQRREVWVDGGHNPSAARRVAGWARRQFGSRPLHLVFASLKSKDARGVLQPFTGIAAHVHTLPIAGHDCRSAEELAELSGELGLYATPHEELAGVLSSIPKDAPVLVFGSLYLAGEALKLNGQPPV